MKKVFLILLLMFLVGCIHRDVVWVEKEPIQCLGNEWEQDYLERNNIKFEEYPTELENKILKEFYLGKGVKIYGIKKEKIEAVFCQACSCPRGDKIKVLIDKKDLKKMEGFGWV